MPETEKFILFLVFAIPSVLLSIIIFIYFITNRRESSKPKNHVWIALLIVSFLQILINSPMSMSFYYLGRVWPATDGYCAAWSWFQYTITINSMMLMAWASIERHFFIFHPTFMVGAAWKKWIYHILPITLCIMFPPFWYIALVIISPNCTNVWYFDYALCGLACYSTADNGIYAIIDVSMTAIAPLSLIILANIALIVRVIYGKISRRQAVQWFRHRKMVLQLWCISALYAGPSIPAAIGLLDILGIPSFLSGQLPIIIFIIDFAPHILPFVYLGVFPGIWKSIRIFFRKRRRNEVGIVPGRPQISYNEQSQ